MARPPPGSLDGRIEVCLLDEAMRTDKLAIALQPALRLALILLIWIRGQERWDAQLERHAPSPA